MKKRISIYQYTDYRKYLKAYYDVRKSRNEGFSYRSMSRQMGFTSPNYLKLVIDGKRHIGKKAIAQIAEGLELQNLETEYFHYLIFFAKAKTEVDRNWYFGQIARLRSGKVVTKIESTQYAYYENWYNCIIRELVVDLDAGSVDYAELARTVIPAIHHKQARQSVELLLDLDFITIDDDGKFQRCAPSINTDNEVSSYAIKRYHTDMINYGRESIDRFDRLNREISSVTMRVSEKGFAEIKKYVQEFREKIMMVVSDDTDTDRVAQLNMQLFPVSDILLAGDADE